MPTSSLRPLFLVFNTVVYAVQIALWVLTGLAQSSSTHNLLRVASFAFLAVVSVCAAVGFLVYGGRLFLMLRRCDHMFGWRCRGHEWKLDNTGTGSWKLQATTICLSTPPFVDILW